MRRDGEGGDAESEVGEERNGRERRWIAVADEDPPHDKRIDKSAREEERRHPKSLRPTIRKTAVRTTTDAKTTTR